MKIMRLLTATIFAASTALVAQEDKPPYETYVAFGFSLAHGHAHDMAQTTWGGLGAFTGEFGIQFKLPASGIYMRPNFGMAKIVGKDPTEQNPDTYNLMGFFVGFDFVYPPFERLPLSFTTGPSFHVWNVDKRGTPNDPNQGNKGMKLGWRLGATYKINDQFNAMLDFALTEWRSDENLDFIPGVNPSRPSYFTIKASYKF